MNKNAKVPRNAKCNVCGLDADTQYEKPYLCMECAVKIYEGKS